MTNGLEMFLKIILRAIVFLEMHSRNTEIPGIPGTGKRQREKLLKTAILGQETSEHVRETLVSAPNLSYLT